MMKPSTSRDMVVDVIEHDGEQLSCALLTPVDAAAAVATTVVLLHGAGTSEKGRLTALLEEFAARGCRALPSTSRATAAVRVPT
jgi:hypothetical protein